MPVQLDSLYLLGIEHFNAYDYFEAHEVWEELWTDYRGPSRNFYKGLIQAAVCLHHYGNGNLHGARKLYRSSSDYLRPYAPLHQQLNVDQFLSAMTTTCQPILTAEASAGARLEAACAPQIVLLDSFGADPASDT